MDKYLIEINNGPLTVGEIAKLYPHKWLGVEEIEFSRSGHLLTAIVLYEGDRASIAEKQVETRNRIKPYYSTPDDDSEIFSFYNNYEGRVVDEN